MRGLEPRVQASLDRRLLRDRPWPIAVALSGGGDSLALTLIADAWARDAGRELLVLTVDHGLSAESQAWTAACAATAARLERPFHALTWEGEKPATGLPAAARTARHRLLANTAREAGAKVILMGHTADDVAEAAAMREAGSTTPSPRDWSPSPVWPEGRRIFLLRPMLEVRRAELRAFLEARGERWIEDPSNANPRFARSRARQAGPTSAPHADSPPLTLAQAATERMGIITLPRAHLAQAPSDDARRLVALATVCAGGGDRLPSAARVEALADRLRNAGPVVATLAGARIEADKDEVQIFREAGEARRGGLAEARLPGVWDGRFELDGPGVARRLAGLASQLPRDQQARLKAVPAAARGGLPAVISEEGTITCPALSGVESLVGARLRAAAGLIDREPG